MKVDPNTSLDLNTPLDPGTPGSGKLGFLKILWKYFMRPLKFRLYSHFWRKVGLWTVIATIVAAVATYYLKKYTSLQFGSVPLYFKIILFVGLSMMTMSKDKVEDARARDSRAMAGQFVFSVTLLLLFIEMMGNIGQHIVVDAEPVMFTAIITFLIAFWVIKKRK